MRARFILDGQVFEVATIARVPHPVLGIGDASCGLGEVTTLPDGRLRAVIDGREIVADVCRDTRSVHLHVDGETWTIDVVDAVDAAGGGSHRSDAIRAPMPGTVVALHVAPGDTVTARQTLMVIESMKLQTSISADHDGVIAEIPYAVNQTFDKGADLIRFVTPAASGT